MGIYNKSDHSFLFKEAQALYEKSRDDNLEDFPLTEREKFHKNGNRQDFEKLYFKRRDYLSSTAILALFDEKYIPELEKIILGVCKEACWALPAHTTIETLLCDKTVDLFVAETAFALAEISATFGDRLSSEIHHTVIKEIRKRLIENYSDQTFWWEKCNMNWAAVCGGYIGGTLLYLFPLEFRRYKERILGTLSCYIEGFTDDGFCFEGPSYWQYGFMAYCVFADLLYRYSNEEEDLFQSQKVKNIAAYAEKCTLKGGTSLSFSDADDRFKTDYALRHYLHRILPCAVPCKNISKDNLSDTNTKWINFYRTIIWRIFDDVTPTLKNKDAYSPDANQLIIHRDSYSLAFKGGHNDEPHNHNDLGSFIYADKNGQVFCDLGSGRYTKDYFDDSKRYTIFCNSSLSHSVPIINSKPQPSGKAFSAKLTYENDRAICDMTNAYDENELSSLIRKVDINDDGIRITDSFALKKALPITERFVSLQNAQIKDNMLVFSSSRMLYPCDKVKLTVKEETHTPHEYDADDIMVYCYDFLLDEGVTEISFKITTQ